jgi:hypothetical protein
MRLKCAYVMATSVEQLHLEFEIFTLVTVAYVQRFGGAISLQNVGW